MTRLNPLMRIDEQFSETLKQHEPDLDDSEMRRRSLETLGQMGIPPDAIPSVSARVLWRDAPANHDCSRPRPATEAPDRGRADDLP